MKDRTSPKNITKSQPDKRSKIAVEDGSTLEIFRGFEILLHGPNLQQIRGFPKGCRGPHSTV